MCIYGVTATSSVFLKELLMSFIKLRPFLGGNEKQSEDVYPSNLIINHKRAHVFSISVCN